MKSGLSFSSKQCEENGWDYPCYISRGRYDDGEFVTKWQQMRLYELDENGEILWKI